MLDFTYDPLTDIGEIRLLIRDKDPKDFAFTDAEIRAMLTRGGSVAGAMQRILTSLLSDRGRRARTFARTADGCDPDDNAAIGAIQTLLATYSPGGALADRRVRVGSLGRGPSDPLPFGARGGCR